MTTNNYGPLVEVFRGDLWEAELVKGFLEANGVQAMTKDESLGIVTSPYNNTGKGVVVLVNHEEEIFAKKIVKENRRNIHK